MRIEHATFAIYSPVRETARRRVEKSNASNRLGREEDRSANASNRNPQFRETDPVSRFETRAQANNGEAHPVSGFVAQILGQIIAQRTTPAAVAHAYAQAKAGSRYQRPLKYA